MLDKLKSLRTLINQYNYTIICDDVDKLELSFNYDKSITSDLFINFLISVFNLAPNSIRIKTNNTMPSFIFTPDISDLNERLLNHINKHLNLRTQSINYTVIITKSSFLDLVPEQNLSYFLKLESLITILINPIKNINVISKIFSSYNSNIILLVDTDEIFLHNATTLISSISHSNESLLLTFNTQTTNLNSKIDIRKNCCNIEFPILDVVPDYFIFDFDNSLFKSSLDFNTLLNNLFILFFLLYLGNYSTISNNIITIKISANKMIEFYYNLDLLKINLIDYASPIQLYYLAYNSFNLQNLYLIRNMISLHLPDDSTEKLNLFFSKSSLILDSTKENLNIMSIENVDKYFSIRYSLYDFLDKSTAYIQTQITELVEKLNKTFLSTLAALIAVSFVYLKDRNLLVLRFSLLMYTIYLILDCIFSYTSIMKSYNTHTKKYIAKLDHFKPIIGEEHYNKILNEDTITNKLKVRFTYYFSIILVIYILMILLGIICFLNTTNIIYFIKNNIL